jgi:outer membrane PBP1 activator LpoA protein
MRFRFHAGGLGGFGCFGCFGWLAAAILTAAPLTASRAQDARPSGGHIALLLPLNAGAFARHADMVRQGFLAAAQAQALPLPVRVYPTTDDDGAVLAAYDQAVESGARLVVGPLTRGNVTALANNNPATLPVPTLALNQPDAKAWPARLTVFTLSTEAEARQVAQIAFRDGRRRTLTISDESPLSRRIQRAFAEELQRQGGAVAADFRYTPDAQRLALIRQEATPKLADSVFIALDTAGTRAVRPLIDMALPVYATSQANPGRGDPLARRELEGVRFVDIPWLLSPQHTAVMIYPRPRTDALDLERLYAFGIDAARLSQQLLRDRKDVALDGVTGVLRLTRDGQFTRELSTAQFEGGNLKVLSDPAP